MRRFFIRVWHWVLIGGILSIPAVPVYGDASEFLVAVAERPSERPAPQGSRHPVSPYVQSMIDEQGGSAVIVLVPRDMTGDEATARQYALKLKITHDSYTAILRDGDTGIVIVGTSTVHPSTDHEEQRDDYIMPYEEFDDGRGGTISFGHQGYDYQVEFYCRAMTAPAARPTCIDAERARAFVASLRG